MNALYGIKFIGFLGIFLHHLVYPFAFGKGFTTFFYIFAGYITFYSFNKHNFKLTKKSYKNYILNKIIKNYPIYIITLLMSIPYLYPCEHHIFNIKDFIIHSTMIQTLLPNYGDKIYMFNGLSWFLANLMIFYLIIPIIYHYSKKYKINKNNIILLVILIATIAMHIIIAYIFRGNIEAYSKRFWLLYISPISRFLNFMLGFTLSNLIIINNKIIAKIPNYIFTILEIIAMLSIISISINISFIPESFYANGSEAILMSILLISVFSFDKGLISKLIGNKIFVKLGKNCIAYYMLHQVFINYFVLFLAAQIWYNPFTKLSTQIMSTILLLLFTIFTSDKILEYIINPISNYLNNIILNTKQKKKVTK